MAMESTTDHERPEPIAIPEELRDLLAAPNVVHLSTLRADGSPPNHVAWVGLEGEHVLVCTRNKQG